MVGEYFFAPGDDGVNHVVVFGDLAGVVEVSEASEGLVGCKKRLRGFVELVELLEGVPGCSQPVGMPRRAGRDAPGGFR